MDSFLQTLSRHRKAISAVALGAGIVLTVKAVRRFVYGGLCREKATFLEAIALQLAQARTQAIKKHRPKRIILIRHGESEGNVDKTVYSHKPDNKLELTSKGWHQALEAGSRLRTLVKDESCLFYVSPFLRARLTLYGIWLGGKWDFSPSLADQMSEGAQMLKAAIARTPSFIERNRRERRPVTVHVDPRLREQEWGNFQDLTAMKTTLALRRSVGRFFFRFKEGESGADVYDRMSGFWQSLFRQMDNLNRTLADNIVIVSHGLLMRLALMRYMKWPVTFFERVWNPHNCEIWIMEKQENGKYKLVTPVTVSGPDGKGTVAQLSEIDISDV